MQCEISAHERRSLYRRNRSAAPLCIPYRATRDPYCNVARNRRAKLNRYFARALATSRPLRHPIIAHPKSGGAVHNEIKGMSPDPLPVVILTEGEGLGTRLAQTLSASSARGEGLGFRGYLDQAGDSPH